MEAFLPVMASNTLRTVLLGRIQIKNELSLCHWVELIPETML